VCGADRKALLLYHPDKTGRGDQDAVFIAVQKAYETLSDDRCVCVCVCVCVCLWEQRDQWRESRVHWASLILSSLIR
jgi:hypothetical protein